MSLKENTIKELEERVKLLENKKLSYQKLKRDTIGIIKDSMNHQIQEIDNFINKLTYKIENIKTCKYCIHYNQCDHLGSYYKEGKWCFE